MQIEIPYAPRVWARPFHASFRRWSALVLHRRAGKTTCILNHHQRAAMSDAWELARLKYLLPDADERALRPLMTKRIYWHVMPTFRQAKMVAWEMLKDFARPIPGHKFNESELLVIYPNENRVQLLGADNPDSLRGPGLSGLSLDEYSQIPAKAFGEVLSKALADHLGYAIFAGTIQGHDQLFRTHKAAKHSGDWFALWQNIDTSLKTEEGPTILALTRAMQDDRKLIAEGVMTQAEFDQEWYLSATAAIRGAYYGQELDAAQREGRIREVPYDPALRVHDVWDLGKGTKMAVGFFQRFGRAVHLIDYLEGADSDGIPQVIKKLREKPYIYGKHFAPHDIASTDIGTGKTRLETAKNLGWVFEMVPDIGVDDGIQAGRLLFSRLWVDETKCGPWIDAIGRYRQAWNEKNAVFTGQPVHNEYSHPADMYRYAAVIEDEMVNETAQAIGGWSNLGTSHWSG